MSLFCSYLDLVFFLSHYFALFVIFALVTRTYPILCFYLMPPLLSRLCLFIAILLLLILPYFCFFVSSLFVFRFCFPFVHSLSTYFYAIFYLFHFGVSNFLFMKKFLSIFDMKWKFLIFSHSSWCLSFPLFLSKTFDWEVTAIWRPNWSETPLWHVLTTAWLHTSSLLKALATFAKMLSTTISSRILPQKVAPSKQNRDTLALEMVGSERKWKKGFEMNRSWKTASRKIRLVIWFRFLL